MRCFSRLNRFIFFTVVLWSLLGISKTSKKAEAAREAAKNSEAIKEYQACISKARSKAAYTKCRETYSAREAEVVKEIQDATSKVKE